MNDETREPERTGARMIKLFLTALLLVALLATSTSAIQAATGTVDVTHADPVDMKTGTPTFTLHVRPDAGGRFLVSSGSTPDPRFHDGDRVQVRQRVAPKGAKVAASPTWILEPLMVRSGKVASFVGGNRRVAVMLVSLPGNPNTSSQAEAVAVAADVRAFYLAVSYGALVMDFDVFGPYAVPALSGSCNFSSLSAAADTAAQKAGVNLTGYGYKVYIQPPLPECGWLGLGTIGGNPARAWISSQAARSSGVWKHEMGHNNGWWHSHSLDCWDVPGTPRLCPVADNRVREYGDATDVMGPAAGSINPIEKRMAGWLVPRPVTAGQYALKSIDSAPDALVLPHGNGLLYVAHRSSGTLGVVVHWQTYVGNANGIYLLRMGAGDFGSPGLPAGTTWTDAGTSIRVDAASPTTGATVTISDGGTKTPPPPPPPPPPPGGADLTQAFPPTPGVYTLGACSRQVGGTSVVRIGTVRAAIANPLKPKPFVMRCLTTPTGTTLWINGVVRLTTEPKP